jgi:hypothetical protein
MLLKKAASFVLGSTKSSMYPEGTPPVLSRLRPRWTTFLSSLPRQLPNYSPPNVLIFSSNADQKRDLAIIPSAGSGDARCSMQHVERFNSCALNDRLGILIASCAEIRRIYHQAALQH